MVEPTVRKRKGPQDKASPPSTHKEKEEKRKYLASRYNPKLSDKEATISHSLLAKLVIGAGAVIYLIYTKIHQADSYVHMARVEETIHDKRLQQFICSPNYKREVQALNPVCLPLKCGRFITDGIVTAEEAHKLLDVAKKGLAKGGGSGGASILDLHSGALSHGDKFINLYKQHPDLYTAKDFKLYNEIKDRVKIAIAEHFNVDSTALYLTYPTFFSELTSLPAQTTHDEYWHDHIDKETYPSFHFTSLLYLTDYQRDFTGGRFVFVDNHKKLNSTVDPKEGRVSAFTSGQENKHRVEPVSGGTRYALTMGFTCDESKRIADPGAELGL